MIRYEYQGPRFAANLAKKYPPELLLSLLRQMLRIRRIEEEIERQYKLDQMKTPIHLVIGQEATAVGSAAALRPTDLLYGSHRTHGNYLAKGGDLKAMMSELFCKANGCAGSRGGSMHLFDKSVGMAGSSAICGGIVPIAAGAALTAQRQKKDSVTMVFFGDGASEEGAVWETLNFAVLRKLPIVFFCENNFYSVCSPLWKRQPTVDIHRKAAGFGLPARLADGVDVIDVYEASRAAVESCRKGEGPQFIEARVYRWRGHGGTGDDSHLGYREPAEVKAWEKFCPVETFAERLAADRLLAAGAREQMENEIRREIEEAFDHAKNSPVPTEADLFTFVYPEAPQPRIDRAAARGRKG